MKACAFTGYRPEKLPFGDDEESPGCKRLKQRLFCETLRLGSCVPICFRQGEIQTLNCKKLFQQREESA